MRKVIYFLTTNNEKKEIMSSATTWGDLKRELGITADLKYVLKETRVTLESSEALLPNTDITIFGFAKKNKSGFGVDAEDLADDLASLRAEMNSRIDDILTALIGNSGNTIKSSNPEINNLADEANDLMDEFDND